MKVILLIFAVVYCINANALRKQNGLRPAKRAISEIAGYQSNSDTYSIHKSREITKSAYLPPSIRDLPQSSEQSARQGITQLKPLSTKLNAVPQSSSSASIPNSGFQPVGNAFGAPISREQHSLSQPQPQVQQVLQPISSPKRTPHEKYGIPSAYAQSVPHPPRQLIPDHNNGYSTIAPHHNHAGSVVLQQHHDHTALAVQQHHDHAASSGLHNHDHPASATQPYQVHSASTVQHNHAQQSYQQQRTEAIFTNQKQESYQDQQSYQAPGILSPPHENNSGQHSQNQEYQAPGYLPPSNDISSQEAQNQQPYEAPGYLPPIQGKQSPEYQQSHEQIVSQTTGSKHQHSNQAQAGYQQVGAQTSVQQPVSNQGYQQEQQFNSPSTSSQPVLPPPAFPINQGSYQNQPSFGSALNNPKPLTSYDPPPSGIPDGLIQPQEPLQIFREPENPQPYDQNQPVYRPQEYSEENGQEGYDYSPPQQKFEDGQLSPDAIAEQTPNQNYDVLSGSSLQQNDVNTREDFNIQPPHQRQQPQQHIQIQEQLGQAESPIGSIAGPVETIRIIDESNRNGQGRSIKTVQIYNEVVPPHLSGQSGSKTIKTIRVLDANSGINGAAVSNNNNGYLPPSNSIAPNDESIVRFPEEQTNNGYLPPASEELKSQVISDNGYLPPHSESLPQVGAPEQPNIHQLLPPLQPLNEHEPEQNNGYLPPISENAGLSSHSSIASSHSSNQETNNGYLPPIHDHEEPQNNGYLPPIENPPSDLNVHQLLPPLPELPKSHSHNEFLPTGEAQTNNGYLPPAHQHESIVPTAVQEQPNNEQYQAPGYLPPVPETPPVPVVHQHHHHHQHQQLHGQQYQAPGYLPPVPETPPAPVQQQHHHHHHQQHNPQYQAPGYLPPHSDIANSGSATNNGYLPPVSNGIEPIVTSQQSNSNNGYLPPISNNPLSLPSVQSSVRNNNVKTIRIIHKKPQNPISLSASSQQQSITSLPQQQQQQQQQQQTLQAQGTIADQQAIYAVAGQAVNSNVKTIRIIHERTAKTAQGRYGNSKSYVPPSIRVIRVFKKK